MERLSICAIFIFLAINLDSQTFSLIIDPIEGDETTFHNNSVVDMTITDNAIVLSGQHSCHPAAGSNNNIFCASLSSFDFEGSLNNAILIDTFFDAQPGGLLVVEDRIYTANFKHKEAFSGRNLYIQEYSQNLELVNQNKIPTLSNGAPNNDGLKFINGNYYVYGDILIGPNNTKGFIQKLDADFNLIWGKQYAHTNLNGCDKVQETNDGNLIYAHQYADQATGPESNKGLQIVKLNSEGIKLDSLEVEGEGSEDYGLGLVSDNEGMIYTYTYFHPTDESIFEQSSGRINKYSKDLDSLIWSLKLPFSQYLNSRIYFISDLVLAKNGDILACGSVFDNSLDGPDVNMNYTQNGFIIRVSTDGEIKWLHIYKSPNQEDELPDEEFGNYHTSGIARIAELDDGRIFAGGTSRLTLRQSSSVIGTTNPWAQFLILSVEGETGCIDGEECGEVIVLDKQYRPRDNYLEIINPDYKWKILETDESGHTHEMRYTYQIDSIEYDTLPDGTIYQVGMFDFSHYYTKRVDLATANSNMPNVLGEYREFGGRLFERVGNTINEKLILDMHLQTGEYVEVHRADSLIELVAISTDTIVLDDGISRKRIFLHCTASPNDTIVWIEGIGELDYNKICNLDDEKSLILCVQDNFGNPVYSLDETACQQSIAECVNHTFSIGDQWIFERFISGGISSQVFEITKEVAKEGKQALLIEPTFSASSNLLLQQGDSIFFWDENLGEFQLNYVFNNDSVYYIRYFDFGTEQVDSTAVFVDSIRTVQFEGQDIRVQYCRSELGFEGNMDIFEVYSGIGRSNFGLPLAVNVILDGHDIGELRCFDAADCSAKFVDFPCDTSFITTATQDLKDNQDLGIYPNPANDILYLDLEILDLEYQILNLQGRKMKQGICKSHIDIEALPSGIYFLQVKQRDSAFQAIKFVKEE